MTPPESQTTTLSFGARAIHAYSRLSYTMWHALAEFIDNSTQSRLNYGSVIDDVLKEEGKPLIVEINYSRVSKRLTITDNSIGMTLDKLKEALQIANPTADSKGRSKYGMGLKTAACWIGRRWQVITTEWTTGVEWTASVNVPEIVAGTNEVPLTAKLVDTNNHGTTVVIEDLYRVIQKRTEETIKSYLGSMYRFDLASGSLKILFNDDPILAPDELEFDTDPEGKLLKRELAAFDIDGRAITGWIGVAKRGGRKFGGFSLFQNKRQIRGYPKPWRPREIFGGQDDEGANNLVSQRLLGLIEMDGFDVSHTKDAIIFQNDEEDQLIDFLQAQTKDFCDFAAKRRGPNAKTWSQEKFKDLIQDLSKEFMTPELQDAYKNSILPPIEVILRNNQQQAASLTESDFLVKFSVSPDLTVIVSLQQRSEHEPHVTIAAGAEVGTIHVIINGLHPYYSSLGSTDALDECVRQYIYDAISEYRVGKLQAKVVPESVRRLKNDLLRARVVNMDLDADSASSDD